MSVMNEMKLSQGQIELVAAMQAGVVVVYQRDKIGGGHYIRSDNHKRVTAEADDLIQRGLAEFKRRGAGVLSFTDEGKALWSTALPAKECA